jgi:hypothetical protein
MPDHNQGSGDIAPGGDEEPFFCLLEDDKMVSKITVESDILLHDL